MGIKYEYASKFHNLALKSLTAFLLATSDCRKRLLESIADQIDRSVVEHLVTETLEGFYDFATHYTVGDINLEEVAIDDVEEGQFFGHVNGSISVTLQYGSDGDQRRGDGLHLDASASFNCDICILASEPSSAEIIDEYIYIDYEELRQIWEEDGD